MDRILTLDGSRSKAVNKIRTEQVFSPIESFDDLRSYLQSLEDRLIKMEENFIEHILLVRKQGED